MSAQNPAVEALGVAVAARVPVLLWGAPGTGKTSAIRAMAEAMDLPCETVIASIREPSDFAGLPSMGYPCRIFSRSASSSSTASSCDCNASRGA